MPDICIITTCKARLPHLQQTLASKVQQPHASVVVVDYSCPEQCGAWVEQNFPGVRVVRVPGQPHFNLSHARNLGVQAAEAPWLCFVDADIALAPEFTATVLPMLRAGHYYQPEPLAKQLGGQVICHRADFDLVEGYDEIIRTYGEEDADLYRRWDAAGVQLAKFPAGLLRPVDHDNALRNKYTGVALLGESIAINRLYALAKFDVMKVTGRKLSLPERESLYENAKRTVLKVVQTGKQDSFNVKFRQNDVNQRALIIGTLNYTFKALPAAQ